MLKLNIILISLIIFLYFIFNKKYYWWFICARIAISVPINSSIINRNLNIKSSLYAIDIISISLILLRFIIISLIYISSSKILINKNNYYQFNITCLILLITLINAFSSNNLFIFYIWFESSLIPTIIIIIIWGYQPERVQARIYIIIYTIIASLPILLTFIIIYIYPYSPIIHILHSNIYIPKSIYILLIRGILVKLPIFLTHLWLPKAHVEAPIAGRIILAAVLLKLGGYGICRLIIIFTHKIRNLSSILISISIVGALITSLICIRQPDLKSLIAYSSVGHIGLLVSGTISISIWGIAGSLIIIIAHGLCSSAIFSLANINYEIFHTRRIYLIKGILSIIPSISIWWFLFTAINIAAPPSINLLSEIILTTATLSYSYIYITLLAILTFLTGVYSLNIYRNTNHGNIINYVNPNPLSNANQNLILIAHFIPLILLIIISEYASIWAW
jgi:NADH-ubiquinone oxidoreductase chain 4